jgi:hypothetical protein
MNEQIVTQASCLWHIMGRELYSRDRLEAVPRYESR